MLGSGAIVVMDETTDMVKACWRVVRFFARESCGKCTPCREGTTWLERILRRILDGHGRPDDIDLLMDICDNISPGRDVAAAPDDHLRARPLCGVADRLGRAALPPRVRGLHQRRRAKRPGPRPTRTRCWPMSDAPEKTTVSFTLDGKELEAEPGELIIAAAQRQGVYVPRFCYHERMEPVGMCRMCLVDIDTGRGPALGVSCMVTVTEGMKVETESERVKKAQEGVLEFLLINHPLDCPVCDKGGECPLQDQTMEWGPGESRMVEEKRHYEKPIPISDLVFLDRERCILCDRCTRVRQGGGGRPAHPLHPSGQRDADPHLPRRALRLVLQRQHRADLPGRGAHGQAVPLQGPARGTSTRPRAPAPPARWGAASPCRRAATSSCGTRGSTATP